VECLNAVTLANLVKRRFELDPLDLLNSQGFAKQVASRVLVRRRRRRQRARFRLAGFELYLPGNCELRTTHSLSLFAPS